MAQHLETILSPNPSDTSGQIKWGYVYEETSHQTQVIAYCSRVLSHANKYVDKEDKEVRPYFKGVIMRGLLT